MIDLFFRCTKKDKNILQKDSDFIITRKNLGPFERIFLSLLVHRKK
jgi:hypothetical protein